MFSRATGLKYEKERETCETEDVYTREKEREFGVSLRPKETHCYLQLKSVRSYKSIWYITYIFALEASKIKII